ncbi:MAG: hypothetical protein V4489_08595 [Chlamydiota bacterium]
MLTSSFLKKLLILKKATKEWPEVVVSVGDTGFTQSIRRATKTGALRKIASKIYSSNLEDTPANIIKRHRHQILSQMFPKGVISHRSALNGGISSDGVVILTYKYTKTIKIHGLTIRLIKGAGLEAV